MLSGKMSNVIRLILAGRPQFTDWEDDTGRGKKGFEERLAQHWRLRQRAENIAVRQDRYCKKGVIYGHSGKAERSDGSG